MDKTIKICCDAKTLLPVSAIVELQGNLAELSKKNYEKLKKSLLKYGVTFAFSVWQNNGKNLLLDGHARIRTLRLLQEEGWDVPDLPVVLIQAKDEKEARKKLLLARSDYHQTTDDGLYEFLSESQIDFGDMKDVMNFSEIDLDNFEKSFFSEGGEEGKNTDDYISIAVKVPPKVWLTQQEDILKDLQTIADNYGLMICRKQLTNHSA